ncbi:glutamine--fructose-6-phosphate transaminase (isomerizing) [Clostridium sp. CAG:265]|uniref:glutamine--fructose-6-phosphate transaminase (isomerizing) n=1 Tax=Clostridium sp. CAG:265 TaxID=1262787 RepID=UPI00033B00A7|nr:glutamine--fructose-6-phosphate transaminase (isomerizing) [Clostridium sp. CAG:265]CDB74695.1 glucosamine--fructose-6-phosphate aminotransferase [isomerizing] [Clostridium sp. CAG:265]
MCGIVGYVGNKNATDFLIEGLSKLEYRGYDSAGIAVINNGEVEIVKHKGRLANLSRELENNPAEGTIGIGHTRWATHGEPSDINSHPHQASKGDITVVHNGIIENYAELTKFLKDKGYEFKSATDTEVIPNLIHYYYNGDLFEAVAKTIERLEGSYALGVICGNEPDKIVAVRKDSPLIVGLGDNEKFIASDIPAVLNYTRDIYLLEDKEIVVITKNSAEVFNLNGEKISKEIYKVTWNEDAAEKGGYDSFMLKEIHEQPKAIRDTMTGRVLLNDKVKFEDFNLTLEELNEIDRIYIIACGTAYNAGLMGKVAIEKLAKIPVEVEIASEFRYREPLVTNKTLIITLSQSGETADTLAVLRDAKKVGAKTLAVTNVVGSSISREADNVIYTMAGPEIAVASTKAYTTQVVVMNLLGMYFADLKGILDKDVEKELKESLLSLPEKIEAVLEMKSQVAEVSKILAEETDLFYLGRGADYALVIEGALKVKEISYVHSEAYAGGELKHGTIALIEPGTKVIAALTQSQLKDKMISNIREVKSRGAEIIAIAYEDEELDLTVFDKVLRISRTSNMIAPILGAIQLQLMAYYVASEKGCDIDKPRNLAKSVTVE